MWPAIITAGAALLGSAMNTAGSAYSANKVNSTNERLWHLENEYNKPINQMARLREAGLNPNLVYGSGATTLAASTKSAQPANYSFPQLDILGAMNAYQDLKQKDAMTENIDAQKSVALANARIAEANARIAEKDAKIYMETGVHPARDIEKNLPSMLRTSLGSWSSPLTDFIGDKITAFSRKWNSEPGTDIIGRPIRKKGGFTSRQQKIYNSYKKQLGF